GPGLGDLPGRTRSAARSWDLLPGQAAFDGRGRRFFRLVAGEVHTSAKRGLAVRGNPREPESALIRRSAAPPDRPRHGAGEKIDVFGRSAPGSLRPALDPLRSLGDRRLEPVLSMGARPRGSRIPGSPRILRRAGRPVPPVEPALLPPQGARPAMALYQGAL